VWMLSVGLRWIMVKQ